MGKKFLPPALALLGGAVGYALRRWQLSTGFEADTALAIPGAPSAMAVMVFSAFMALLFLLLCRREAKTLSWDNAFAAGAGNTPVVTVLILASMLLLASGGLELLDYWKNGVSFYAGETAFSRITTRILSPLRIALCLGGFPCVFLWSRSIFRKKGGNECLPVLEPCILYCVWLISIYQSRAAAPVIQDYLYEVLAVVFTLLGLYFIAGFSFGNGKPQRALFFCLMGTCFSLVTLADSHTPADLLRYLFAALYLTAHAVLILNHPPVEEAAAEEETEADKHA